MSLQSKIQASCVATFTSQLQSKLRANCFTIFIMSLQSKIQASLILSFRSIIIASLYARICLSFVLCSLRSMLGVISPIKKAPTFVEAFLWLPDLDSNQDKLHQKQLCYRYTIRQSLCHSLNGVQK